ncbi:MAG: hypothetical protein JNL60_19865 [Bacteroidia bacterium]|nr:hypothetical protein [Bacteroidia bacterium]
MKKIICFFLLFVTGHVSYSQMQEGNVMLGLAGSYYKSDGNLSYNNSQVVTPSSNTNEQIQLNVRMGYMLTDRFVLGGTVLYSKNTAAVTVFNSNGSLGGASQVQENYGFGVFGRYYKMFGEGRTGIFAHLRCNYIIGVSTVESAASSGPNSSIIYNLTGYDAGLVPGVVFFVSKRIGVEATFGNFGFTRLVEVSKSKNSNTRNSTNVWNMNFALTSTMIGINFYFGSDTSPKQ